MHTKIRQLAEGTYSPSPARVRAIAKLCRILGIQSPVEEQLSSETEARRIQYDLLRQVRRRNKCKITM